uniref:Uncharacterized protein n=1 Tax=Tanacetum cinerariifolium TaxID=118510 RepID=A0A6L2NL80_TANCI|nr:hypothetical protein [Tanacetum cinerariifolium]
MAKIQQNNNNRKSVTTTFSIWSSCHRKILNALRCGTHHHHHRRHTTTTTTTKNQQPPPLKQDPKPKKSEKLSELLKMCEMYEEEEEEEVRRMCKDDGDGGVRMNFGLLGVIPPLVAMVDSGSGEEKTVALYALLNLGIANDE